jgi:PIN domain nuclease of toxin-antitoxin system
VRLLLDTHIFIWLTDDDKRLRPTARRLLTNASEIYISSATIWEIAIKARLNKINANPDDAIQEMRVCGFLELPVEVKHAAAVARLPLYHSDPFDRLLIAQAIFEDLHLVTADRKLVPYSDQVILV